MTITGDAEIRLKGLSRAYVEGRRRHVVLDDVDAQFACGESVAIRGRSGSGKSTLLNMVGGIDAPDSGQVIVSGTDVTSLSERDRTIFRRKNVGFVYQAFNLVPTLTVADNIRLVLELNEVNRLEADQRVERLLVSVGLEERATSYPDILSGGEQQRVAVARAICHEPSVVLADEPTGNLDDATAENILELLRALTRQTGCTMIIATHSARIASFCDRVMELHDGKLGPQGTGPGSI